MRKILTASQAQELDRWAIEDIGIPAICLMENAGRLVADEAERFLKVKGGCVSLVCGSGNNGGDGLVAARYLWNKGVPVSILLVGERSRFTDEVLENFLVAVNLKIPILSPDYKGIASLGRATVIIDALLGIGLSREVDGEFRAVVEAINTATARVISVDIPSGVDGTTGKIRGVAVKADVTVTLAHPKQGLYIGDGLKCAGRIKIVDIGIPHGYVIK